MMSELTLLTTLAFHHLVIGCLLTVFLYSFNWLIKSTPEMRSWVWMTGFIIVTLLPFTLFSANEITSNSQVKASNLTQQSTPNRQPLTLVPSELKPAESKWHFPSEVVFEVSGFLRLFIFIWLCGSLWRCYQVLASFIRTQKLIKRCRPLVFSSELFKETEGRLFSAGNICSPMVVGLFSPKIILPKTIVEQLEQDKLAPIVLHELAHIQRRDIWFGLFQEMIAIVFWWSPVIRILNRRIHIERELACDLRAANKLSNRKQYAQSLIDCAKLMITQHRSLLSMGLFSQKKELTHRITQVLNNKKTAQPSLLAILTVCIGLSVTSIQATQSFSPKISISQTQLDSKHFSLLPQKDGEKLIAAVYKNDIDAIKQMQNRGIDINTPAINDGTALIIAVKENNQKMVEALIDLGADVNQSSLGDGNPLIMASMTNNLALAILLINRGADVNQIVIKDETPLINASREGYLAMTQLLVASGADVNLEVKTGAYDGYQVRSPLNMAKSNEVRQYLIDMGAQ